MESPKEIGDISEIDEVVTEILRFASQDARDNKGTTKFRVGLCFKKEKKPSIFKRFSETYYDGSSLDEEISRAQTGREAQMQRHNEMLIREVVSGHKGSLDALLKENARLRERNEQIEDQFWEMLKHREKYLSREHEREMTEIQVAQSIEMKGELLQSARTMIPVLVNYLSGDTVFETESPQVQIMKNFVESLEPDQLASLMHLLKPHQQAAIASLVNTLRKSLPPGEQNGSN
jgi:hypothetical protein